MIQQSLYSEIVTHYEMDETKRNYAVILNHEIYDETFMRPSFKREGTNVDCKNLKSTLEYLSCEVDVFSNLTLKKIAQILKKGKFWFRWRTLNKILNLRMKLPSK